MVISKNKVVSLTYELRTNSEQGEVADSCDAQRPLTFIYGIGNLLPKFEEYLGGLSVGGAFKFKLTPQEGYGELDQHAIVEIPLNVFEVDGSLNESLLRVGNNVPMMDRDGNRLNGLVKHIGDNSVTMDFNHPMAGKDLFFSGSIVDVREATAEELEHGHIHSQNSCDCGCDSEGDCSDENCNSDSSGSGSCGCGCN